MKNIITRALAVALLTTSISAFAAPGNSKSAKSTDPKQTDSDTTVVIYVVDEPNEPKTDQDKAEQDQRDEKSTRQKLIEQQDKRWLHDLQGIYGG